MCILQLQEQNARTRSRQQPSLSQSGAGVVSPETGYRSVRNKLYPSLKAQRSSSTTPEMRMSPKPSCNFASQGSQRSSSMTPEMRMSPKPSCNFASQSITSPRVSTRSQSSMPIRARGNLGSVEEVGGRKAVPLSPRLRSHSSIETSPVRVVRSVEATPSCSISSHSIETPPRRAVRSGSGSDDSIEAPRGRVARSVEPGPTSSSSGYSIKTPPARAARFLEVPSACSSSGHCIKAPPTRAARLLEAPPACSISGHSIKTSSALVAISVEASPAYLARSSSDKTTLPVQTTKATCSDRTMSVDSMPSVSALEIKKLTDPAALFSPRPQGGMFHSSTGSVQTNRELPTRPCNSQLAVCGMEVSELVVDEDWIDPCQPSLKSKLLDKLGVGQGATVERMRGCHGGQNMGLWMIKSAFKTLVVKMVTHTRFMGLPTEAEYFRDLACKYPQLLEDESVAFPTHLLTCIAKDGSKRDLIVMKKAEGECLVNVLVQKLDEKKHEEAMQILRSFGTFLAGFHARHGLQHGDCNSANVIYNASMGIFTLIDVADMGNPRIKKGDVPYFIDSVSKLTKRYGSSLCKSAVDHFEEGYQRLSRRSSSWHA